MIIGIFTTANAQFKGAFTLGLSANQLDGDGLAGFHKLGLTGGVSLFYPIKEKWDMGLEMLYTQRGSAPKIEANQQTVDLWGIHLDYLEVPLFVRIKDWYIEEDDYYIAFADLGFSGGYLFNVNTKSDLFDGTIGEFNKYDLSFLLGVGIQYSKRWSVGVRYTKSILPIYGEIVYNGAFAKAYNWNVKMYYNL